ncbi:hypothetical protein E4T42_04961 [Aureobasidium subglaciale]|nr:hypothetical protein E4T42_04961 [Aureobasidium subglaciale]
MPWSTIPWESEEASGALDVSPRLKKPQNLAKPSIHLHMPAELWEIVLDYLTQSHLFQVRNTHNKQLCVFAKPCFARTLPDVWRFVLTVESMVMLERLTADPDYVPHCKHISFGSFQIRVDGHVPCPDEPRCESFHDPWSVCANVHRQAWSSTERKMILFDHRSLQQNLTDHNKVAEAQEQFLDTGEHTNRIVRALSNLMRAGMNEVTLGIREDYTDLIHDEDYMGPTSKIYHGAFLSNQQQIPRTLNALRNAIEISRYPLEKLVVVLREHDHHLSIDDVLRTLLDSTPEVHITLVFDKAVGRSISILKTNADYVLKMNEHDLWDNMNWLGLPLFVKSHYGNLWDELLAMPLRTIQLSNIRGYYRALERVLSSTAIEHLDLTAIQMAQEVKSYWNTIVGASTPNTAIILCQHIKKLPKLTSLRLENIRDDRSGTTLWIQQERVHWEG